MKFFIGTWLSFMTFAAFAAKAELKVMPQSVYGYPIIKVGKQVVTAMPLKLSNKKGRIAEQTPYSPITMDIKKVQKNGDKFIIIGSFLAAGNFFQVIESIEKTGNEKYLVCYLITARKAAFFDVRIYGGIGSREIIGVKNEAGRLYKVPGKNKRFKHIACKKSICLVHKDTGKHIYINAESGIGVIQIVDKRKWGQGIRMQFFSARTGCYASKKIKAGEAIFFSFSISTRKPEKQKIAASLRR